MADIYAVEDADVGLSFEAPTLFLTLSTIRRPRLVSSYWDRGTPLTLAIVQACEN